MSFAQDFIRHGEDVPYKGYVIGTQIWTDGPIYRVYSADGNGEYVCIEYEGDSVEDCKAWVDGVVA